MRAAQEFRCPAKQNSTSWCVPRMTSWINQMASYIRSIDGNHMARTRPRVPVPICIRIYLNIYMWYKKQSIFFSQ